MTENRLFKNVSFFIKSVVEIGTLFKNVDI
jgi:hypothetical protein